MVLEENCLGVENYTFRMSLLTDSKDSMKLDRLTYRIPVIEARSLKTKLTNPWSSLVVGNDSLYRPEFKAFVFMATPQTIMQQKHVNIPYMFDY